MDSNIKRGDIYYADLSPVVGSEQGGSASGADRAEQRRQPVQSYRHSRRHYIAGEQGENADAYLARRTELRTDADSIILTEQIRTLDKRRLREKMGSLDEKAMRHVDEALAVSFGLGSVQG